MVLLSTSPRVAPGLLTADAWAVLAAASSVAAAEGHPLTPYVEAQGQVVRREAGADARSLAARLVDDAAAGTAVWLVGRDGDPELGRTLAELVATGTPVELEMLPASYDLPGAALLDLVATMDRLRSPGGCPWDAEQTHESLTTYLLEETYETLEAIETGDRHHLREELGDLLLQVVFHSRIAEEHAEDGWSVDDVASGIVAKLVRRHPHVFGPEAGATTAADVEAGWHARKAAEKGRESAVDGVPTALPALALAAKLMHRAASHGVAVPPGDDDGLGSRLMELVAAAQAEGLDAEAELRAAARRFSERVRLAERGREAEASPG
ncbi:MAG TPA: MazG family protein [Actinomycetes bacterium]|nr:MazG family protein [Actinomycetes bacterium]